MLYMIKQIWTISRWVLPLSYILFQEETTSRLLPWCGLRMHKIAYADHCNTWVPSLRWWNPVTSFKAWEPCKFSPLSGRKPGSITRQSASYQKCSLTVAVEDTSWLALLPSQINCLEFGNQVFFFFFFKKKGHHFGNASVMGSHLRLKMSLKRLVQVLSFFPVRCLASDSNSKLLPFQIFCLIHCLHLIEIHLNSSMLLDLKYHICFWFILHSSGLWCCF